MADSHQYQYQDQDQHLHNNDGNPWTKTRQQPLFNDDDLNSPYYEPRMFQSPLNLSPDDSGEGMSINATSDSSTSTIDSLWSFESTRDMHEFIREVNGRSYNAQNTTYFLPAGQSEFKYLILHPYLCSLIFPHPPMPFP